jgi:hypothetical protein
MLAAPLRLLARSLLLMLLTGSLILTLRTAVLITRDPLIRPMVDASLEEITAASDRMMAKEATPERIAARLAGLLAEDPRNWVAIQAVEGVAAERGLILAPDLAAKRAELWDDDSGYIAQAGDCVTCIWDAGTCTLTNALVCNAPVSLSPVGDVVGLGRAGVAWATGGDVDQIDLALSIVGLGATAAILASGGTSLTLKLGAGTIRLARKMRLLSPRLTGLLADVATRGIDWQLVTRMDFSDPARLIRADVTAPLASIASDLGRIGHALPATETLHLLRYVDDAADARRLANATEALGARTLGRIEVLGKSRFLRTTIRASNLAIQTLAGFAGLLLGLATVLGCILQSGMIRLLRRRARPAAR